MSESKLVELGTWTSEPQKLGEREYNPGKLLKYTKSLTDEAAIPDDYAPIFDINKMRQAAEVHRQVRRYIQPYIVPGIKLKDLCTRLEAKTVALFGENNLHSGIGFPTGVSLNECAAHDSAIPGDERVIGQNDVCKIDYGTHVDGWIIDSAFTVAFEEKYRPLLQASKEATWEGIRLAGPDALVGEISAAIKETIESFEVELDGKTYPIKPVSNLGGHNILQYQIHGGLLILNSPSKYTDQMRLAANSIYAIETFASTGKGFVVNSPTLETSHYMKKVNAPRVNFRLDATRKLFSTVTKARSTLPFCTRWLVNNKGYRAGLSELEKKGVISSYPPLVDQTGSYSSQFEHTIYLHEFGKEVLSAGDDY